MQQDIDFALRQLNDIGLCSLACGQRHRRRDAASPVVVVSLLVISGMGR
jgi:hypothetical protein